MKNKHLGEEVLSIEKIQQGVKIVAARLNKQFNGQEVVVISLLPGGMLFTADLVRQLKFDIKMDFVSCPHTPGDRNNKSDVVYCENINIQDQHIILVDDALESGSTMKKVAHFFEQQFAAKSISIATLFVKPGRINIDCEQYFAYEMENDELLVGYGLPWQDKYRNVPFVCKLIK